MCWGRLCTRLENQGNWFQLLWPSFWVKHRGFCKMSKGSMEGCGSNQLEIPTSKGDQDDLVSQSCLQRTHLMLLESFLKNASSSKWKFSAGMCPPLKYRVQGVAANPSAWYPWAGAAKVSYQKSFWHPEWVEGSMQPSLPLGSSDRPSPFANPLWQKKKWKYSTRSLSLC